MRFVVIVSLVACVPARSELRAPVDRELARRIGAPITVDDPHAIDALLAKPLDADAAVKIALVASPRLRAALDELGIAGAEVATALAPGATHVDVQFRRGGGATELEIDAIQPILSLITGGQARAAAHADVDAARANAAATALRLAARVEIAFHDLLAAQQELELRRTALEAADAAATIRERMHAAGNTTDLALARDRDAREQARVDVGRAEAGVTIAHAALDALLGLTGDRTRWTATGELAPLPAAAPKLDDLESAALAASLELTAGRARSAAAGHRLSDERRRAILPELGIGVSAIDRDQTWELGPALRIGIPLLDWRSGPRARAAAEQARADHELAALDAELHARAVAARTAALAAFAEARRLHDDVLPLRQTIVDETLKHYNAMDADPFQLVVARRELVDAGHQYLDALRRYANAMTEVAALRRGVQLEVAP